jgi:hypothetical protein
MRCLQLGWTAGDARCVRRFMGAARSAMGSGYPDTTGAVEALVGTAHARGQDHAGAAGGDLRVHLLLMFGVLPRWIRL